MKNIIFGLISIFLILLSVCLSKEHKKMDLKLKEDAESVKYTDYLVCGSWIFFFLVGIILLLLVAINMIFM